MAKRVTRLGGLLAAYQRRDPAARSKLEIFLLYPGVHAVLYHRLVIDHGMGIIIGETAEIGDDCLLYQGVISLQLSVKME